LARRTTNDTFIIAANTNGQLFVGNGVVFPPGSRNFEYYSLFSSRSSASETNPPIVVPADALPTVSLASSVRFTNVLPGDLSITSPPVSWVYLTNPAGQTNARFAYWVEDLSGKLDLSVVGANLTDITGDDFVVKRPTGTNPAEIALWSLFDTNAKSAQEAINGVAQVNQIISARNAGTLLTPATSRLLQNSQVTTNMLADLAVGLRHDTNELDLIPLGFGYADQGKPKYNLNTNINAVAIGSIPDIINRNLDQFGTRGGAMSASAYLQNLSASIIDYADTNSTPTVGGGNPPTYRGTEAMAWPNEVYTRVEFIGRTNVGADFEFRVGVKHAVEIWNLSDKQVEAGSSNWIYENLDIPLAVGNGNWTNNLATVDPNNPPTRQPFTNTVTLKPNSFGLLQTDTRVFKFLVPTNVTTNTSPRLEFPAVGNSSNYTYSYYLDNQIVDATPGGRFRPSVNTNLQVGEKFFPICSAAAYGTGSGGTPNLAGGDPRGQLFILKPSMRFKWTEVTPGGRNQHPQMEGEAGKVDPATIWPDGGHSSADTLGAYAASDDFDAYTNATGNPDHWLQRANDSGRFNSIVELGYIFDPIQWQDPANSPYKGVDSAAWTNLASATATAFDGACGRNSLRIGRPEHTKFAVDGLRAVQLLDIFAVGAKTNIAAGALINSIPGRININTATTNTLRALAAGVTHTNDAALKKNGSETGASFVPTAEAVSAFVNGVTNFRATQPFFSPSQLAVISNVAGSTWPQNAIFGNPKLDSNTIEWNDAAAEEWFAKVYPLATVRSRNFLVHAVGEALDVANGKTITTVLQSYQIYMRPQRNGAGSVTNSAPVLLRSWQL
jgi:hypothetical protein